MKTSMVNGVTFPGFISTETYDNLRDFHPRSDDLFIVTYPKSGTTWTQQIVKLIRSNGEDDQKMRIATVIPWIETLTGQDEIKASIYNIYIYIYIYIYIFHRRI